MVWNQHESSSGRLVQAKKSRSSVTLEVPETNVTRGRTGRHQELRHVESAPWNAGHRVDGPRSGSDAWPWGVGKSPCICVHHLCRARAYVGLCTRFSIPTWDGKTRSKLHRRSHPPIPCQLLLPAMISIVRIAKTNQTPNEACRPMKCFRSRVGGCRGGRGLAPRNFECAPRWPRWLILIVMSTALPIPAPSLFGGGAFIGAVWESRMLVFTALVSGRGCFAPGGWLGPGRTFWKPMSADFSRKH